MNLLSNFIKRKNLSRETFVSGGNKKQYSVPKSSQPRIGAKELEMVYLRVPMVYTAINLKAIHTISPWFEIESDNPFIPKFIEEFNNKVEMKLKLVQIMKHCFIYGNAYAEIVFDDATETQVLDFVVLDPKSMDVEYDDKGVVLNYVQKTAFKTIKLEPKRIAHFKINELADDFFGVGLIEPMYLTLTLWMNTENSIVNAVDRHGFPKYHIKVGKEGTPINPDRIKNIGESFEDINSMNEFVTPWDVEINPIDTSGTLQNLDSILNYQLDNVSACLGVPQILLGKGQGAANRSVGNIQLESWQREIRVYEGIISNVLVNKVYNPLLEGKLIDLNKPENNYDIEWASWGTTDENQKAQRLLAEYQAGVITTEEYREQMGYDRVKPKDESNPQGEQGNWKVNPQTGMPFGSNVLKKNNDLEVTLSDVFYSGWEEAEKDINMNVRLELSLVDTVLELFKKHGLSKVTSLNEEQKDKARSIFESGIKEKKTLWDLQGELERNLNLQPFEAERLVRTEMKNVKNLAKIEAWNKSGVVSKKKWVAQLSEACPVCRSLNGQVVGLNEDFKTIVDGKKYESSSPPMHPNCVCSIIPQVS